MKVELMGITHTRAKDWPSHSHNSWEIILNLEGSGFYTVDNKTYPYNPGSIICLPPGTTHSKSSNGLFRDIYIRISEPSFHKELLNNKIFCLEDDEEKTVEMLMRLALRIYYKKEFGYLDVLDSLSDTIYVFLMSLNKAIEKNKDIELYKNIMIENFTNPEFGIADARQTISYNQDYFGKCFKKETDQTPSEFLNNLRMDYASKLLRESKFTKLSISEISYMSGFYDKQYFSRVFKKKYGVSPRSYLDTEKQQIDRQSV